jgi:tungstate transport system substrate-binding protein
MKTAIKKHIFKTGNLISFILALTLGSNTSGSAGEYQQIVIATGSPFELGLVQALAKPFEKETGYTVRVIKTPTEPGLELGQNGMTHITMGHAREATARLIAGGFAFKHSDLMYNLTVIVGPKDDPAKIEGLKDLTMAHQKIYEGKAKYLARGDGGGMDLLEKKIWASLRLNYAGQPWYSVSQKFMLDSLIDADRNGQYHMLDSSTWVMHKSKMPNLKLMVQGPRNEYEICLISPEKLPNLKYNFEYAEKFYHFCLGERGQNIIAEFGKDRYGESIYFPWPKK